MNRNVLFFGGHQSVTADHVWAKFLDENGAVRVRSVARHTERYGRSNAVVTAWLSVDTENAFVEAVESLLAELSYTGVKAVRLVPLEMLRAGTRFRSASGAEHVVKCVESLVVWTREGECFAKSADVEVLS